MSVKLDTSRGTYRAARTFIWGLHWPTHRFLVKAETRKPKADHSSKSSESKRTETFTEARLWRRNATRPTVHNVCFASVCTFWVFFKQQTIEVWFSKETNIVARSACCTSKVLQHSSARVFHACHACDKDNNRNQQQPSCYHFINMILYYLKNVFDQ